ncbi:MULTISPECIES: translocation/assembly module TamB domain-containing protein [Thalassospira]|uniref:Translocation/assembly module TamB domain-containing protein n=1 Tax=Thalassospira aquimaris TaxID=3037796 RepID=A0ABT6GBN3_9PROT|nr:MULTISPECIES: translocation/assembly module TamB domain-containing protein [Thalassospira]MDG4719461.1 translocation/assembly module TamB domain-containing protein [Thalassospira sp. FZY0004]
MKHPRSAWRWARYGAYGVGGVALVAAGIVALAGTGPVLRAVTPLINDTVSEAIDGTFTLGRIEGSLWTGLAVESLLMDQPVDGLHLELGKAEFDWSPLALLGGQLHINRVGLQSAKIILPDGTSKDEVEETPEEAGGGFALPLAVAIDAVELSEIAVVEPVSGKSFLYGLNAKAAIGTNLSAVAAIDLHPLDGGIDRLVVDLDFDGPEQRLKADIDGELDREGIVMTLAGLEPDVATDVRIRLAGDGPADNWKGRLDLSADGYAALASDIGIQLSLDVLGFALDGGLETFERINGELPDALRKKIDLGVGGAFDADTQRLSFDRVTLAMADAVSLNATGDLDLAENQIVAKLDGTIDPAMSALMDDAVTWGQVGLSITAAGDLAMPGVELAIRGQNLKTPVSTIGEVKLDASIPEATGSDVLDAKLAASTTGTEWQDGDLAAFLGDVQELSLNALISKDFSNIAVRDLALSAPMMKVLGDADINEEFAINRAGLNAVIADLAIFAPISGLDLGGQGSVALDNLTWSTTDGLKTDVKIATTETGFGIADLDRIVGASPVITGQVSLLPDLDLTVDLDALQTAMITGPVTVNITDEFGNLAVKGDLDVAPGTVPPDIGVSIAPAKLLINLDGDIAAPAGTFDLSIPTVEAGGQRFDKVALSTRMAWSDQAVLSLANNGRFTLGKHAYNLAANVRLPDDGLHVAGISLRGDFLKLSGDIVLPDYATPIKGRIALSNLDAEMLGDFGAPFSNGALSADVAFVPDGDRQTVTLAALANGLRLIGEADGNPEMIENIELSATVRDAFNAPDISANVKGRDIVYAPIALDDIALDIQGGLDALHVVLGSSGLYEGNVPVLADLVADIGLGDDITVTASKLDLALSDQAISLHRPLQFVMAANGSQSLDADLAVGTGKLVATMSQQAGQKSIAGDVSLDGVDLGPWGRIAGFDGLTGVANLTASLRETKGALPAAEVKGRITGITAKTVKNLEPFEMVLDLGLAKGTLNGTAKLGNAGIKVLSAEGTVPLAISVLQQNFSPDLSAPVSASVRMNGEIAEFWPYVPAPDHLVSGLIKLELDVAGTLDDIAWNGNVDLSDGHYENLSYGTILDDLTLRGDFDQNGLSIPSITATDGGNGTLDASIDLKMKDGGEAAYDVSTKLRNFALSRIDELQFWADVDTNVTGNQNGADIKSAVTVQRGEVDLTLALPESVPTIDVANLPGEAEKEQARKEAENDRGFAGNLDVKVDIPRRLFVRGRGLDSEWGGALEITGTTDEPIIVGQLAALRGQLDIIGKTFVIKDSKITFAGGSPPDPMLDIKGVYSTTDLEVTAGFEGPASDPELVLTSNPSLPDDEILSQVLFGKSQGSLSAVEAVQLASAVNELSGGGGGLDIVGSVRRFIGADVLQVGGGENGPEVKVGKYLADGVYVGTKAGSSPGSSGVEVEIEVTPNISVTSETTEIDSKAGVQYRLDY